MSGTELFQGIGEHEIRAMLPCLLAREKVYDKAEIIFHAGDTVTEIGLVEQGSVNVVVNFYWGDSNIFGHIGRGDVFAQNFAALPGLKLNCDIVAAEKTTILFLNLNRLLTTCQRGCSYHQQLIYNLVGISAAKNLDLSNRMMHIAPKSIRGRLLSYLSAQAQEKGDSQFTIPFSRQQLADYLGVDRSALSHELSKMRADGLLTFHKNEFKLNNK